MDRYRSGHNGPDSKSGSRASGSWVRIPPYPPHRRSKANFAPAFLCPNSINLRFRRLSVCSQSSRPPAEQGHKRRPAAPGLQSSAGQWRIQTHECAPHSAFPPRKKRSACHCRSTRPYSCWRCCAERHISPCTAYRISRIPQRQHNVLLASSFIYVFGITHSIETAA